MCAHFKHPIIGQEIESISSVYAYTHEKRLDFENREVLCFIGYAVTNNSCCGAGGCMFALVAGFINEYSVKKDGDNGISVVVPVNDEQTQKHITACLQKEGVSQVQFFMPDSNCQTMPIS